MVMELSKLLTIVIPCKNEDMTIQKSLSLLNFQKKIRNVRVIVCDVSDDEITSFLLQNRTNDNFDLEIIGGGLPSVARNKGAKLSKTPFILFLDADVFLLDPNCLVDSVNQMMDEELDLFTYKFRTTTGEYNYVFKIFDLIQKIFKPISPFCVGGFMMIRNSEFKKIGGFDEDAKIAEDYLLSKQINPKKFKISNLNVFTTPRRFKKKGIIYMVKIMIGSFLNKNNKLFFQNDRNYWS